MLDKDAIQELSKAEAIKSANAALHAGVANVALPDNFSITDLEKYLPNRRRARGAMETPVVASFSAYVRERKLAGTTVFVSQKNMVAVAILNIGTIDLPGHADDIATLKPVQMAAYSALRAIANGGPLEQSRVAEFLEDWAPHITASNDEGPIDLKKAIGAVRNISIEGLKKVESSEQQLSASRSAFESVKATSKDPMPTVLVFKTSPYQDFSEREFGIRLGIRTSDKPAITLRLINIEQHEEEIAAELSNKVSEAIGDACSVLLGGYAAK